MNSLENLIKNKQLISFFSYYHLNVNSVTVWRKVKRVDVELKDKSKISYSFEEVEKLIANKI